MSQDPEPKITTEQAIRSADQIVSDYFYGPNGPPKKPVTPLERATAALAGNRAADRPPPDYKPPATTGQQWAYRCMLVGRLKRGKR